MQTMMTPTLPAPSAFGALKVMIDFLSLPPEVMRQAFDDYAAAEDTRKASLEQLEAQHAASVEERSAAAQALEDAEAAAADIVSEANSKADGVVATATRQAEDVTTAARASVQAANQSVTNAKEQAAHASDGLAEREESVVRYRAEIDALAHKAKAQSAEAARVKAVYTKLVEDFNKLRGSVPERLAAEPDGGDTAGG